MATYKAIVKVEYQFEFECDLSSRREIQEEAEKQWEMLSGYGIENDKYHDTEVDFQTIE